MTATIPDHLRIATIDDLWARVMGAAGAPRGKRKLGVKFWSLNSKDKMETEPYTMTSGTDTRKLINQVVYRRIFVEKEEENN